MPRRFVRDSKFRHVFGEAYKKTKCYDNIDISKNTWDGGNYCAVNSKFVAIVLERCCFIVLPVEKVQFLIFFFKEKGVFFHIQMCNSVSLRIQSEFGKIWTRITLNMDTFYAVLKVTLR